MNFTSQYPSWIYLICVLIAFASAYFLYHKDKKLEEFKPAVVWFLAGLRFVSVLILLILLTSPLVLYFSKKVQEPILIVALDNSSSMLMSKDSSFVKTELIEKLSKLKEDLGTEFQVDIQLFDEGIVNQDKVSYTGKTTSFSRLFDDLRSKYSNRNVAAMLLISDGIYNRGINPLYQNQLDYPIYTLAIGDTSIRRDAAIDRVRNNELAFLGNSFPVEVDVKLNKLNGERGTLKIFKGEKELFSKAIVAGEEMEIKTASAVIEAKKIGLARYKAVLSVFKGEEFLRNNTVDFYVDILDGRQRILILAQAPHPDIKAIKSAIGSKKNYEVNAHIFDEFEGNAKDYNLIIFHHLPNAESKRNFKDFLDQVKEEKISSLYILGSETNWNELNQLDLGLQVSNTKNSNNQVTAIKTSAFPLFEIEPELWKRIERFPPVSSPVFKYTFQGQANNLLRQKIGSVETEIPLFSFLETKGQKNAFLFASNIWRWNIYDFFENESQEAFQSLLLKSTQYLALKADKSYFRLNHAESFLETENLTFDAQFYNESYELNNQEELSISLSDEKGKQYKYTFSKNSNAYYLRIPSLPIGNYNYLAQIDFAGKTFEERGQFSVRQIQIEQNDIQTRQNLLFQLANKSGAELLEKKDLDKFKTILNAREDVSSLAYQEEEIEEIINFTWILYLLLATLGLEWFIRKRAGAY